MYVEPHGELALQVKTGAADRTNRTKTPSAALLETRGWIKDMIHISERPAEADDRAIADTGKATCSSAPTATPRSAPW
jgi:hypothetical protein